ncbi:MAG: DNA-binding HxlR family transcriptional regulator [Crocinitomicaceae bacterium]|jgi:DNA-binding HxlR family transcriptional regulator
MQVNDDLNKMRSSCSITCALDLVGDKWTLIIIRDALFTGAKSFGEFSASREKIATNILTNRLDKLVSAGIFTKTRNATNKLKFDYLLTNKGLELKPILIALGKWGCENVPGTSSMDEMLEAIKK